MTWIHPLREDVEEPAEVLGGKAHGLIVLRRLGLPVPPGFVITTDACRAYLRDGRFPGGLGAELAAAVADLEVATGRKLGGPQRPLAVSVRSGGSMSMPGMMTTVLNLGLTAEATAGLAAETGDSRFAHDARQRFLSSFAAAVGSPVSDGVGSPVGSSVGSAAGSPAGSAGSAGGGEALPDDANAQLERAVAAVLLSWDTPRARTYRELHGIPHDLGTAVTVQAMVFGNRDQRSGSGVAFSRDPSTGEPVPFGEVLFGRQGDDVVSGRSLTLPLRDLADREPALWDRLLDALDRVERHYRDAGYLEFTFEAGKLWTLQVRPGRFTGAAAVRVAVDLADAGLISRGEALRRITPRQLQHACTPRIVATSETEILARGLGASPGVAAGRVATTAGDAARMAADGPVILVRPETSPSDLHGLAAAAGVLTARGGPASHAAVVARSMGKPAVVGAADLTLDAAGATIRAGGRTLPEGALITLDGTSGEVVTGRARVVTGEADPYLNRLLAWAETEGDPSAPDEAAHDS